MSLFVSALRRRAQRVRAAWLRRIRGGGRSALRLAQREPVTLDTPVEPLLLLLDRCAER